MSENEYIGSEEHFQAIQRAAGMTTAEDRKPETMREALGGLFRAFVDLIKSILRLWVARIAARVFLITGNLLIRIGWDDGRK